MKFQAALLLFLVLSPAATVRSEPAPSASWMEAITRLPPGDHANLRPVKLDYTLAWNNRVNAGKFEISVVRNKASDPRFVGDASGRSTGFARVLWPYDFRARSIVDEDSLRPVTFQLSERERNDESSYDIIFEAERQIFTTTSRRKNEEPKTATSRFGFDFGQDILSSAFYLRSQPLKNGDEISMLVTPFNRPYLAQLRVVGREKRKIKGTDYDTIKLDAQVGRVNADLSLKEYEKIKSTTLWISDDEYRIPLELQSQIAVGFVSARLFDMEWLD